MLSRKLLKIVFEIFLKNQNNTLQDTPKIKDVTSNNNFHLALKKLQSTNANSKIKQNEQRKTENLNARRENIKEMKKLDCACR